MQDQIANIENRLEELKSQLILMIIVMTIQAHQVEVEAEAEAEAMMAFLLDHMVDEFDELTRRFNRLQGNHPPLPPPRTLRRPHVPRPDVESDLHDVLNNRLKRLRYGPITPIQEEKISAKRLSERQSKVTQIPKGTVKSRKSDVGLFQPILLDTPPPTPNRGNYWPPPPVGPSDINFIKSQFPPKSQFLSKTKSQLPLKPIIDNFARPLTKIIDDEKNTINTNNS